MSLYPCNRVWNISRLLSSSPACCLKETTLTQQSLGIAVTLGATSIQAGRQLQRRNAFGEGGLLRCLKGDPRCLKDETRCLKRISRRCWWKSMLEVRGTRNTCSSFLLGCQARGDAHCIDQCQFTRLIMQARVVAASPPGTSRPAFAQRSIFPFSRLTSHQHPPYLRGRATYFACAPRIMRSI